jgi:hypothetical protein
MSHYSSVSAATLASLKALCLDVRADPQLLHTPDLHFLRELVHEFGGKVPAKKASPPPPTPPTDADLRDEECVDADVADQRVDYVAKPEPSEAVRMSEGSSRCAS